MRPSGQDQDVVPGANFVEGHHGLDPIDDTARIHRPQPAERIQGGQRAALCAPFERLAQQQETKNQQDGVEIHLVMAGRADDREG